MSLNTRYQALRAAVRGYFQGGVASGNEPLPEVNKALVEDAPRIVRLTIWVLVAAVAGGAIVEEDATLSAAQVFTPSMEITPANIHPLNVFPWPSPTGALYTGKHPPRLRGQEAFVAKVENSMAKPSRPPLAAGFFRRGSARSGSSQNPKVWAWVGRSR